MKYLLSLLILFFLLLANNIFAQLQEEDKRLKELVITRNTSNKSIQKIKLYFQNYHGIYLVFYDYKGEVLYLKYKDSKWEKTKWCSFFKQGITYQIQFHFKNKSKYVPRKYNYYQKYKKKKLIVNEDTKKINDLYIGRFISAENYYKNIIDL